MNNNNVNSMDSFTRGSQLFMHSLRMIGQGTKAAIIVSLFFVLMWLLYKSSTMLTPPDVYYWVCERWATMKFDIGTTFYGQSELTISVYDFSDKAFKVFHPAEYKHMVWNSMVGKRLMLFGDWLLISAWLECLTIFSIGIVLSYIFFAMRGRQIIGKKKTRGGNIVTSKELASQLKKAKMDSQITIGNLPLVKGSERQHIFISGTIGTGKTNLLHEILPQIRAQGDKAVVVDLTGSFIGPYYQEGKDFLLNPFDNRSEAWTPWVDCHEIYDYDDLAAAIIGGSSHHDSFWDDSAKKILAAALYKHRDKQNIRETLDILNKSSLHNYSEFFKNTDVAALADEKSDKTATSIRAALSNKVKALSYLEETTTPFSIKDYITNIYDHNLLSKKEIPTDINGRVKGIYLYQHGDPLSIDALVIHNNATHETLNITKLDGSQQYVNKLQWPVLTTRDIVSTIFPSGFEKFIISHCKYDSAATDADQNKDSPWLFITAMPSQRKALAPLLASWIEIAISGLMKRDPLSQNSNIWIIIDELPGLGKIPSLKTGLAEGRKYGGCVLAAAQNIHQLIETYGRDETHSLLDQFNSRFIFRVGDQETAQIAARMLGEQEIRDTQESFSYGSNTMRDGVNINTVEKQRALVLPTEIMTLPNLACYVKLAGNWPVTKLSMQYNVRDLKSSLFIAKLKSYPHYIITTPGTPDAKGNSSGIYLYRDKALSNVYALVIHNNTAKETLHLTNIKECAKHLFAIKWPANPEQDRMCIDTILPKQLEAIIMANCHCGG